MTPPSGAPRQPQSKRKIWNYTPPLPIETSPYWDWPMKPLTSLRYLLRSWNPVALRALMFLFAVVTWTYLTPSLERIRDFGWDWVFEIWLRNFCILMVIAGGLHLALWKYRVQADEYRYDMRPMMKGARVFTFRNQVWDNMFWTLGPALTFWTVWESYILYAYANGWVRMITPEAAPVWFAVMVLFIPIWAGFHFYWLHRLLHVGKLYTHVHAWHHRNINTGPWSGLAMHPVESFFLMFDTMIFFLLPSHPVHAIFLLFHHGIGAPTSHSGFEHLKIGKSGRFLLGDFFHQLHHKFFDCNYGTWETPWDEWFDTFHDGSEDGNQMVRDRRGKIWAEE